MTDTKRSSTKTHTDPGDDVPTTERSAPPDAPTGDQDPTSPSAARSFAGSGTTEPLELNPATHGTHYRGTTGDV